MSLMEQHAAHLARRQRLGMPLSPPTLSVRRRLQTRPTSAKSQRDWLYVNTVPPITEICRAVAAHFDITVDGLLGESRIPRFVWPRQVAQYLSYHLTNRSLLSIAHRFQRDHTSILNAIRRVDEARATDARLNGELGELAGAIGERTRAAP